MEFQHHNVSKKKATSVETTTGMCPMIIDVKTQSWIKVPVNMYLCSYQLRQHHFMQFISVYMCIRAYRQIYPETMRIGQFYRPIY